MNKGPKITLPPEEKSPLSQTEKEVEEVISEIQKKAEEVLQDKELALKIGQKVRENLVNLVEVSDAIRWAQKVLEEKGFVREEANQIAKKLIGKEIKPVAIRFQTSLYQEINRGYEELNNTLFSILEKTTTDPSSVQEKIEKTLNSLLTEEFGKLDPKTAAEKLKENLARALENLDEETRNSIIATIVLKVQSLQKLAQLSFRWQESPAKPLAFQRTIPQQQQEAMKIKRLFIQSLKESYLRKVDEIKIEDLTRKIIEKLEQRAQILRLLSEEDFANALKEELKKILTEEEGRYGPAFCQKIQNIKLSPQFLQTFQKIIERFQPQVSEEKPKGISAFLEKSLASHLSSLPEENTLVQESKKIAPKNKLLRFLYKSVFRLFSFESPKKTLTTISSFIPKEVPFSKETFPYLSRLYFYKRNLLKFDPSSFTFYPKIGFSATKKLFSKIGKKMVQGLGKLVRKIGTKLGIKALVSLGSGIISGGIGTIVSLTFFAGKKLLKKIFPKLKEYALAGIGAGLLFLSSLFSTLGSALLGIGSLVGGGISALFGIVTSFSLPTAFLGGVFATGIVLPAFLSQIQLLNTQSAFLNYTPAPLPPGSCQLTDPLIESQALILLFQEAGKSFNVPPAVIAGVAAIEGRHLWGYNDTEINAFSLPGAQDPYNCAPNVCGARGPMQFLTGEGVDEEKCPQAVGVDIWSYYKNAVNEATGENRTPHVCNIKDSIFAAAKKLKNDSRTTKENNCQWNKEEVYNAARGYYGKCEYKIKVGPVSFTGNYCERVWQYYLNHSQ